MRNKRSRVRSAWNAAASMFRAAGRRARQFGAFALPIAFSWVIAVFTMLLALSSSPAPAS